MKRLLAVVGFFIIGAAPAAAVDCPAGSAFELRRPSDNEPLGCIDNEGRFKISSVTFNSVDYDFPLTQGAAATFLKNDGAGALTWEIPGEAGSSGIVTWQLASSGTITSSVSPTFAISDPSTIKTRISFNYDKGTTVSKVFLRFNSDSTASRHEYGTTINGAGTQATTDRCGFSAGNNVGITSHAKNVQAEIVIFNNREDGAFGARLRWEGGFERADGLELSSVGTCRYLGDGSTTVTTLQILGDAGTATFTGTFEIEEFKALP